MNPESAIELLRQLVAIPSVNPALTDEAAIGGEARMVDWLETWFANRGFSTRRFGVTPGRPNLLALFGPDNTARTLLFESHLDTVGVEGFQGDPFALHESNGRLHARGACDTKGPLAAFMAALDSATLDKLAAAGTRLAWLGAVGEETGNYGAEEAVAEGIRADECVVLEPTDLHIVHAHKGVCWFKVTTRGKAAHGSDPARGDNAILKIPDVWKVIANATAEAAARHVLTDMSAPTVSLGTIHGGTGTNVVPDRCEIQVDRRIVPGENCEEILADLRSRLAGIPGGVDITLLKEGKAFHTDATSSLPQGFGKALKAAGLPFVLESAAWCSDAGVLAPACGQTIVWGPGSIAQAHTADEYIETASLQSGVDVVRRFLGGRE